MKEKYIIMKKHFLYTLPAVALTSVFLASGCASIVSDSSYPVAIQSSQANVNFTVKDENNRVIHSGQTPVTLSLNAGDSYFSKANYTIEYKYKGQLRTFALTPSLDGWYIGNILIGGPIGLLIIDPLTGAMYKLPETVDLDMSPEGNQSLVVKSKEELPKEEQDKLVRLD